MRKRIIFHIDVNSAYLSWTSLKILKENPEAIDLRTIPAVIGGDRTKRRGVVLAKSIPAKKYGIKTGEPIAQSLRKYPDLTMMPPDFDWYVKCSNSFMRILSDFTPDIERASIDEAYCDMTGTEQLFGSPQEAADKLKNRIFDELGFTVNIGISTNKLLAKMASDFEKPFKVHTLFPEEIPDKIWPLPVRELYHVGGSTEAILHSMGIRTIGDLAHADLADLKHKLKKNGELIYHYANGIDPTPVESNPERNKHYGSSTTTPYDITQTEDARMILLALCETVCSRLRHDKVKASCVSVNITDHNFQSSSHQTMLHSASDITNEIYDCACTLLDQFWDGRPLRLLGVSTTKINEDSMRQYSLFDTQDYEKHEKLDSAIDQIRSKFGENAVQRARFLDAPVKHLAGGMGPAKLEHASDNDSEK